VNPLSRTWLVSVLAALVLELAIGALIVTAEPPSWVQNTLGALVLAVVAAIGAAIMRRYEPDASPGSLVLAAGAVPAVLAVFSLWGNIDSGASTGRVAASVLLAVAAIGVGIALGSRVPGRSRTDHLGSYR
jgi:hypothetical protein